MSAKERATWAKTREKGKVRFVLVFGVLIWGLLTGLLFPIVRGLLESKLDVSKIDWSYLPISLVLFPIGGIAFGLVVWDLSEKRFAEWQQNETPVAEPRTEADA